MDKLNDDLLNYPDGAFSRLFDFCIALGFWINSMIFSVLIPFLAPSLCHWALSVVLQLDNFSIYLVLYTMRAKFFRFGLDNFKGF